MFACHTGLRTRIPAYVSAYSYVHMQVWHSSVYPWAHAAFRKRVEFGSHASYGNRRGVYRSDPRYEKRRWGGGGGGGEGGLYASDPLSIPVRYTYSMVKVTSLWGVNRQTPPPPPPPTPLCVEYGTLSRSGTSCYFSECVRTALQFTMLNKSKARQL